MERKLEIARKRSPQVGPITVSAFIPSTSFIPGHHIPVTVCVAKEDSQKVHSIGIKLIRLEQNPSRQTKLSRIKSKDFISPGDVTYEMDLLIPKKIRPKTTKEDVDERRYEVRVSVKIARLKSCRLCLPVRIEAVGPTKGRILEPDNDVLIPMFAFK